MVNKRLLPKIYISTVILLMLIWQLNISLPNTYMLIALATSVVLLGLPHGALDFAVANSLGLVSSLKTALIFLTGYMVIASVSIIFWLSFPAIALVIFLSISIYHFGADWRQSMPRYAAISLAALIICGPSMLYSSTVQNLFTALLVSSEGSANIIVGMQFIFALSLTSFVFFLGQEAISNRRVLQKNPWAPAEWLTLVISALTLTPLLHFALYFCLLHSPKHMCDIAENLNITLKIAFLRSIPFVLLSILIGIVCYMVVVQAGVELSLNTVLLRWLFIGLFGLTMSHMLLISAWHRAQ